MGNRVKNESDRSVKKQNSAGGENQKKPFNKKKYREQKYSNKFKVNQWEQRRKEALLRELHKDMKREEKNSKQKLNKKSESPEQADSTSGFTNKKKSPFWVAKQEFLRKKEEEKRKKEEIIKAQKEKEEALKKYKEKKMKTFRELSKKTKKGQPVMKGRMELLLEKIQQSV